MQLFQYNDNLIKVEPKENSPSITFRKIRINVHIANTIWIVCTIHNPSADRKGQKAGCYNSGDVFKAKHTLCIQSHFVHTECHLWKQGFTYLMFTLFIPRRHINAAIKFGLACGSFQLHLWTKWTINCSIVFVNELCLFQKILQSLTWEKKVQSRCMNLYEVFRNWQYWLLSGIEVSKYLQAQSRLIFYTQTSMCTTSASET